MQFYWLSINTFWFVFVLFFFFALVYLVNGNTTVPDFILKAEGMVWQDDSSLPDQIKRVRTCSHFESASVRRFNLPKVSTDHYSHDKPGSDVQKIVKNRSSSISQSPKWRLQVASFVQWTDQNLWASSFPIKHDKENQQVANPVTNMLEIFFKYESVIKNSCRLIFFPSTAGLTN